MYTFPFKIGLARPLMYVEYPISHCTLPSPRSASHVPHPRNKVSLLLKWSVRRPYGTMYTSECYTQYTIHTRRLVAAKSHQNRSHSTLCPNPIATRGPEVCSPKTLPKYPVRTLCSTMSRCTCNTAHMQPHTHVHVHACIYVLGSWLTCLLPVQWHGDVVGQLPTHTEDDALRLL